MTSSKLAVHSYSDDRRGINAFLTPWSLVHAATGVVTGALSRQYFPKRFWTCLVAWSLVHLAYESKDVYYSYTNSGHPNSFANSVGDQSVFMTSFSGAWALGLSVPAALMFTLVVFVFLASPILTPTRTPALTPHDIWNQRG
jgi:hypothetical protein